MLLVVDVVELNVEEVEREGLEDFRGMLDRGPVAATTTARLRRTSSMDCHKRAHELAGCRAVYRSDFRGLAW